MRADCFTSKALQALARLQTDAANRSTTERLPTAGTGTIDL